MMLDQPIGGLADTVADARARLHEATGLPSWLLNQHATYDLGDQYAWERHVESMRRDMVRAFNRSLGAKAPVHKRKRRVAKKIARRGGYLHHRCLGAFLAKAGAIS